MSRLAKLFKIWKEARVPHDTVPEVGVMSMGEFVPWTQLDDKIYELRPKRIPATLSALDSKARKGKPVNLLKLVGILCCIHEVRSLVYNNKWGFVVRPPKHNNMPVLIIIKTLHNIIKEGLTTPGVAGRRESMELLSGAEYGTIGYKIWRMFTDVKYDYHTNEPSLAMASSDKYNGLTNEEERLFDRARDRWLTNHHPDGTRVGL